MAEVSSTTEEPVVAPRPKKRPAKPRRQPRYNVILWNDNDHTYEYVITMLQTLFGHPKEKGFQLAHEVHTQGKAIVFTTTREHAELKRDQVHAYGKDRLIDGCQGSMWCSIEPEVQS